jgi:hypothetical protein
MMPEQTGQTSGERPPLSTTIISQHRRTTQNKGVELFPFHQNAGLYDSACSLPVAVLEAVGEDFSSVRRSG